ncbi:MAG: GxxExxY protein [Desulfatiglandales bacterium]
MYTIRNSVIRRDVSRLHHFVPHALINCSFEKLFWKTVFAQQAQILFNRVNQNALLIELLKAGLSAEKEKRIQVYYDDQIVRDYVADIIVEDNVILELKSVKELHDAHSAQLVNYLKATSIEIGLLINFGESVQIKRRVFTPKDCS